jgi:hypothetical protein
VTFVTRGVNCYVRTWGFWAVVLPSLAEPGQGVVIVP